MAYCWVIHFANMGGSGWSQPSSTLANATLVFFISLALFFFRWWVHLQNKMALSLKRHPDRHDKLQRDILGDRGSKGIDEAKGLDALQGSMTSPIER